MEHRCAIEDHCDYFITTDKPLLRYTTPLITICTPVQFLDYLEDTNHD
jgi:hypothetical protein